MKILAHIYIFRAMHRMLELHLLISEGMLKVFSVTSLHLCRYDWDKQSLEQKKKFIQDNGHIQETSITDILSYICFSRY